MESTSSAESAAVRQLDVDHLGPRDGGEIAHPAQQPPAMRGVPRARLAISRAPSSDNADLHHPRAALHDLEQFVLVVEIEPHRNAETVAQRRGEKAGARGGADQRELGEVDLDRARRRPLADDEVELEILHRRIEHFFHRRVEAVDLVDEQHVALLEIGEERRKIAGLGDDGPRGGLEVDAELARHDLRQRRLAQARGASEQHMVQRLAAGLRRLDEDAEVLLGLGLADEFLQPLRPEMRVDHVFRGLFAAGHGVAHARASSFSARRISFSVGWSSPALRIAAETAAPACAWP